MNEANVARKIDQTALEVLDAARPARRMIATAESCTGGLIAAALTETPGSSDVFERGFVTYSNAAKTSDLGVDASLIQEHGAVSAQVAKAMALGAIASSQADLSIAVTGVAGPGGGTPSKPVGLVHIAVADRAGVRQHRECHFGAIGRRGVREATVLAALEMLRDVLAPPHG